MSRRTFIAIPFSTEIKQKINEFEEHFKQKAGYSGRLIPADKIHLTLKFLGDTNIDLFDKIEDRLSQVGYINIVFKVSICGIGVFPNLKYPRVLWLGLKTIPSELIKLKNDVEKIISPLGFPEEKREFHPHLTISRIKQKRLNTNEKKFIKNHQQFKIGELEVSKIEFIESHLTSKGAIYTTLHSTYLTSL